MRRRGEEDNGKPAAAVPLLQGGTTLFPGWAIGTVFAPESAQQLPETPRSAILVVKTLWPEIMHVLPYIRGLVSEQTDPAGSLAARIAEYGLPSVLGVAEAVAKLRTSSSVLLDASARIVYAEPEEAEEGATEEGPYADFPLPWSGLIFDRSVSTKPARSSAPKICHSLCDIIAYVRNRALSFNEVSGK